MKINFLILLALNLIISCNNIIAQIYGCTDPLATNYNIKATNNDGSCIYKDTVINITSTILLPQIIKESSGLIFWNEKFWTHNDDTDINLYSFDKTAPSEYTAYSITGTKNIEWEELQQDDEYIYIGDTGNNANGNRTDLKILRIEKKSLLTSNPIIDSISFSYSDQTDFMPTGANNTNFDCEAFIVSNDSIYLFTKQWITLQTAIYSLSKTPGCHIATFKGQYNINGLITGAFYNQIPPLVVLCGYNKLLQPFLFLLYDFANFDFFSGNKRMIYLNLPLHQVEAITSINLNTYYLTNEYFSFGKFSIQPMFNEIDLSFLLMNYLEKNK